MSKKKYYAVKSGKKPGIYETWDECKNMVEGYSNAEYKSFNNKQDAIEYLNNKGISENHKETLNKMHTLIAFVDGSYSDTIKKYSYGCVFIMPSGEIIRKSGSGNDPKALEIRNVAGELQGTMYAIKYASQLNYKQILIKYDYAGIEKWYTGEWKAKDDITKMYVEFLSKYRNSIDILFEKVIAHTGNKYNEEADKLAKGELDRISVPDDEKNTLNILGCKLNNGKIHPIINFTYQNEICINSETIIDKFKSIWKKKGRNIKDIKDLKIIYDIYKNTVIFLAKSSGSEDKIELKIKGGNIYE